MIDMKQINVGLETMVGLLVAELEYLQFKVSTEMNDMASYYEYMTAPKVVKYVTYEIMIAYHLGKDITNETSQYVLPHEILEQHTDGTLRTAIIEAVKTTLIDLQLLKFG